MWWFYALMSAVFASLTAIFAKVGVTHINSNLATAIRTAIILLITWLIVIVKGDTKDIRSIPAKGLWFLIISGVATGLSWLCYFKALQLGNVSQVAAIDKLSVAFTIVLAVLFLKESFSMQSALGAALIVAGAIVLVWK